MAEGRRDYTWLGMPQNTLITPWDGKVYHGGQKIPLSEAELAGLRRGTGHRFAETEPQPGDITAIGSYVDEQQVLRNLPRDDMGNPMKVRGGKLVDRAAVQQPEAVAPVEAAKP